MGNVLIIRCMLDSIAIVLSLIIIIYSFLKGRRSALLSVFILLQLLALLWLIFDLNEAFAMDDLGLWRALQLKYAPISFIGTTLLLFSLFYVKSRLVKVKPFIYGLFFLSGFLYLIIITNESHHLFYKLYGRSFLVHGVLFWPISGEFYGLVLLGVLVLIRHSLGNIKNIKRLGLIVLAVLIPFMINLIMNITNISPGYDPTPLSFPLTFLLFLVALFKYRFLDLMPVALRKIFDHMKESIVVIDNYHEIIECNHAFTANFTEGKSVKGDWNLAELVNRLKDSSNTESQRSIEILNAIRYGVAQPVEGELSISTPVERHFWVIVRPMFDNDRETAGRIVSFNEITEYKQMANELSARNMELAVSRERNRMAMDIHDTLGHTMSLLIKQLELTALSYGTNPGFAQEELSKTLTVARNGMAELKQSVAGLMPEKLKTHNLLQAIKALIADFGTSGMNIELSVEGLVQLDNEKYADVLYRVCQEALTNALRHGKANGVVMMLRFTELAVKLFIDDNGVGCDQIRKGFGLSGMEERVRKLGGNICYGSEAGQGFHIYVEIPLQRVRL